MTQPDESSLHDFPDRIIGRLQSLPPHLRELVQAVAPQLADLLAFDKAQPVRTKMELPDWRKLDRAGGAVAEAAGRESGDRVERTLPFRALGCCDRHGAAERPADHADPARVDALGRSQRGGRIPDRLHPDRKRVPSSPSATPADAPRDGGPGRGSCAVFRSRDSRAPSGAGTGTSDSAHVGWGRRRPQAV